MRRVRIWTDGCCLRNPGGPGGWAFVAEENGRELHEANGGTDSTTNNRMEILAVLEALRWAEQLGPIDLEIVTDSKYVQQSISHWMASWKRKGWRKGKNGKGAPVQNTDLWLEVDRLVGARDRLRVSWVRGHNGSALNERADRLADAGARGEAPDGSGQALSPAEAQLDAALQAQLDPGL